MRCLQLSSNLVADGCWRAVGIDPIIDISHTSSGSITTVHFCGHLHDMSHTSAAQKIITTRGVAELFFERFLIIMYASEKN